MIEWHRDAVAQLEAWNGYCDGRYVYDIWAKSNDRWVVAYNRDEWFTNVAEFSCLQEAKQWCEMHYITGA